MDLIYFEVAGGNFGDDLNRWIWDELLPGFRSWDPEITLVGVGTILKMGLLPEGRRKLVLGSGVGYGQMPNIHANPEEWDIRCVRGPATAAALGLPSELGVVDPAALLPELKAFANPIPSGETIFVPHIGSLVNFNWNEICAGTGITPVSPAADPTEVVLRIAGAKRVIAESMHAAIIADAFRVPWRAVAVTRTFNTFKWNDWAASVGVDLNIRRFFPTIRRLQSLRSRLKRSGSPVAHVGGAAPGDVERLSPRLRAVLSRMARTTLVRTTRDSFQLSNQAVLDRKKQQFRDVLADVRRDYGS